MSVIHLSYFLTVKIITFDHTNILRNVTGGGHTKYQVVKIIF
jgi:hypothetical protein